MAAAEPVTDDQGFSNLYLKRKGVMLSRARRLVPDPDDVEDVVHEAWLLLLSGRADHTWTAVRRAAKEWRSRLYGRTRDGNQSRTFWYYQEEPDSDELINKVLRGPEPPSPADLQARVMRAVKEERS